MTESQPLSPSMASRDDAEEAQASPPPDVLELALSAPPDCLATAIDDNIELEQQKEQNIRYARGAQPGDSFAKRIFASVWGLPGERKLPRRDGELYRNLAAFFIVGLLNNFSYVVMLSAADEMLEGRAGVVLLCDIIPGLLLKLIAPWFMHLVPYNLRILIVAILAISSFQFVAWFEPLALKLLGVCFASLSSSAGEITFLSMSHYYHKNTVAAWSSGTGGAGVAGALAYLALTAWLRLSSFTALMIITVAPFWILFATFVLMTGNHNRDGFFGPCVACIKRLKKQKRSAAEEKESAHLTRVELETEASLTPMVTLPKASSLTVKEKILHIWPLFKKFMLPLFLVYWAEYVINQGVSPTLRFQTGLIKGKDAYKTYALMYQIGVFVSRSSVTVFPLKRIYMPSILQALNLALLLLDSYFRFIPSIWIVLAIIFWEGLLGGSVYVNAFYLIRHTTEDRLREFSLGITAVADSLGIACAGLTSAFLQPWLMAHQRKAPF